jgi:transcriptional regulator with XRE-family HTH domain
LLRAFGVTVRRLRDAQAWSQEQLAEKADLNRSYVGEIERGQAVVSIVTLEKLAQAFGVTGAFVLEQCEKACEEQPIKGVRLTSIAC